MEKPIIGLSPIWVPFEVQYWVCSRLDISFTVSINFHSMRCKPGFHNLDTSLIVFIHFHSMRCRPDFHNYRDVSWLSWPGGEWFSAVWTLTAGTERRARTADINQSCTYLVDFCCWKSGESMASHCGIDHVLRSCLMESFTFIFMDLLYRGILP